MLIIQTEKDNDDGWCEVDERPSILQKPDVTDTKLPNVYMYTVKQLNTNDKYINV